MSRWNKARIITTAGHTYHKSDSLAESLVDAGLAVLVRKRPLTIRLVDLKRVGRTFVPSDCKNFIEEVLTLAGYRYDGHHRTRKPRKANHDPLGKDNRNYMYNYQLPDGKLVAEEVMRKRRSGQGGQVGQS